MGLSLLDEMMIDPIRFQTNINTTHLETLMIQICIRQVCKSCTQRTISHIHASQSTLDSQKIVHRGNSCSRSTPEEHVNSSQPSKLASSSRESQIDRLPRSIRFLKLNLCEVHRYCSASYVEYMTSVAVVSNQTGVTMG